MSSIYERQKKRKLEAASPVSVADTPSATPSATPSTTTSPRMPVVNKMQLSSLFTPEEATQNINEYRSGNNTGRLDPAIQKLEDERKEIHSSLQDSWTKNPKMRKDLRDKSDNIKKMEAFHVWNAAEIASRESFDKPANTKMDGILENPYTVYHGQYTERDNTTHKEMEEGDLTFGGRKCKTRKNKKSKKHSKKSAKKSRKSRKSRKSAKRKTRRKRKGGGEPESIEMTNLTTKKKGEMRKKKGERRKTQRDPRYTKGSPRKKKRER